MLEKDLNSSDGLGPKGMGLGQGWALSSRPGLGQGLSHLPINPKKYQFQPKWILVNNLS